MTTLAVDATIRLYYKNNVKTGTATMVVHGLGQYGGYKKVKFSIVKYRLTD